MKSAKDILKQMAFNPNSKPSTQDAFLKALQNSLIEDHKAEVIPVTSKKLDVGEQLSFDLRPEKNKKNRA